MTVEMYHGNSGALALHPGLCLTNSDQIARDYAIYNRVTGTPVVHTVELDLTGLTVVEVEGFDRDENVAAGDDFAQYGADVIIFSDEDMSGREHATWRLMSDAALAAVTRAGTVDAEEM